MRPQGQRSRSRVLVICCLSLFIVGLDITVVNVALPSIGHDLDAAKAVAILHRSGVPGDVLHLLPGSGEVVGAALTRDPRIAGIAFTGSTEVAKAIQRTLADRTGPIVPLIAETGGQNAMIVDSTALPEQVARDALASAFDSAGQRCSALRVLFVQDDVADKMLNIILGAMDHDCRSTGVQIRSSASCCAALRMRGWFPSGNAIRVIRRRARETTTLITS